MLCLASPSLPNTFQKLKNSWGFFGPHGCRIGMFSSALVAEKNKPHSRRFPSAAFQWTSGFFVDFFSQQHSESQRNSLRESVHNRSWSSDPPRTICAALLETKHQCLLAGRWFVLWSGRSHHPAVELQTPLLPALFVRRLYRSHRMSPTHSLLPGWWNVLSLGFHTLQWSTQCLSEWRLFSFVFALFLCERW